MSLEECMTTISHKEMVLRTKRKRERSLEPTKSEYYMMQLLRYMHMMIFREDKGSDFFQLKFSYSNSQETKATKTINQMSEAERKEYADKELAVWSLLTGYDLINSDQPKKLDINIVRKG